MFTPEIHVTACPLETPSRSSPAVWAASCYGPRRSSMSPVMRCEPWKISCSTLFSAVPDESSTNNRSVRPTRTHNSEPSTSATSMTLYWWKQGSATQAPCPLRTEQVPGLASLRAARIRLCAREAQRLPPRARRGLLLQTPWIPSLLRHTTDDRDLGAPGRSCLP